MLDRLQKTQLSAAQNQFTAYLVAAIRNYKAVYLMSTEQTPVFFAAPKHPVMLPKLAKGGAESFGDSARGPTWQSHGQRFPAASQ